KRGNTSDLSTVFGHQLQALKLTHVRNDVKHPAPAHVDIHFPEVRHIDDRINIRSECWHVLEGNLGHLSILAFSPDSDKAGGRFQLKFSHRSLHGKHPRL